MLIKSSNPNLLSLRLPLLVRIPFAFLLSPSSIFVSLSQSLSPSSSIMVSASIQQSKKKGKLAKIEAQADSPHAAKPRGPPLWLNHCADFRPPAPFLSPPFSSPRTERCKSNKGGSHYRSLFMQ